MDESNDGDFEGPWAGAATILAAVLSVVIFVFWTDPINTGGVIASVALGLVGLAQILAPHLSPWFQSLGQHWRGLVWVLVGGGLAALGVVSASTSGRVVGGLILGGFFVLYGCFIALGWETRTQT